MADTIYALSSGRPPAGVAVVRLSGPGTRAVVEAIAGPAPAARRASLRALRHPETGLVLDRGLVIVFERPQSFTGEDAAEFHVHGGRAVVAAVLGALGELPGLRAAEAGEFTRRAFENGRIDLTAVEGLADLIAAETDAQRRQALRVAEGALARRAEDWRDRLLGMRAAVEADLDFSDEEDVPGSVAEGAIADAAALRAEMLTVLADAGRGERVREGFEVALMGAPNAGKSSLLNALARRDVAIVTEVPGTTRDVLEVHLDLGGHAVTVLDTAGLRDAPDRVEAEGVRRAKLRGAAADLILWLDAGGSPPPADLGTGVRVVRLASKADLYPSADRGPAGAAGDFPAAISALSGEGLPALIQAIQSEVERSVAGEPSLIAHARQRERVREAADALDYVGNEPLEVVADGLRRAGEAIGRLTGRIDVEDVLGSIFSRFCIGK
jgi:tRNA modification GTPase